MTYVVKLDYLTLNFEPEHISLDEIGKSIAGRTDLHWLQFRSDREDAPYQSPLGLFYRPNCGSVETPHVLQVHGTGCENFRASLPVLCARAHHVRRADFCFDVIMSKQEWREWLGKVFSMQWDKRRKKIVLVSDGDGSTVYVGARSTEHYFRVYNKSLQNPDYTLYDALGCPVIVPEDCYIIRYECEMTWKKRQFVGGEDASFDPTPLVASYYQEPEKLFDFLRALWIKHGNEVLLPHDFANSHFVTDLQALNISAADWGYLIA